MLDQLVQLHECLEIHYYVDHYAAELYTGDGEKLVLVGRGKGILEAIANLEEEANLRGVEDWLGVRKMTTLKYKF